AGTGPAVAALPGGAPRHDRLSEAADLGREGPPARGRRDTARQPREARIRSEAESLHAGEAAARRPHLSVRLGLHPEAQDGDPLDILIIHDTATYPGLVLKCKPIGVLEAKQP